MTTKNTGTKNTAVAGNFYIGAPELLVDPTDSRITVVTGRNTNDAIGLWRFFP